MASRKDYTAVANILKEQVNNIDDDVFTRLILDFGAWFKQDNTLFDLRRFEGVARGEY